MRVLITGASRGLGAAVARLFARRGGSGTVMALLGRSLSNPSHPALQGTLLETAQDVTSHGAVALPFQVDLRDGKECTEVVSTAVEVMGGLDVLIHNASALHIASSLKRMDLLYQVNTRATLLCLDVCRPHLEASSGSVVTLAPPIDLARHDWIAAHPAYTLSKYSMTLATLGCAASPRVRANCVWPRHTVATAATKRLEVDVGFEYAHTRGRDPHQVAEAVYSLATHPSLTGKTLFDDEVLCLAPTSAPLDVFASQN
jgi:citronellol/citronellal dehydrogenase